MRWLSWILSVLAIVASSAGAVSQETRGFLVLEGEPGFLTNTYLEPTFATWDPAIETGFATLGGTGLLEWSWERTTASITGAARWIGFADSTPAWQAYLFRGALERRLGGPLALGAEGAASDVRRPSGRRTLFARSALEWTVSPRVRLSAGPGWATRRFRASGPDEDGGPIPPLPGTGEDETGAAGEVDAVSWLLFAGLEAWPGDGWKVQADAFGATTAATDLGVDYRGAGGSLRVSRLFASGGSLGLGASVEGFGYRAAVQDGAPTEVPDDDLIWRGEATLGWPLGRRIELRARLAGLGRSGGTAGEGDVLASLGIRVTLGGLLSARRRPEPVWVAEPGGIRFRIPYDGAGRLYLVGDFNDWADPGHPLRPQGGGVHGATLELSPGTYRYRIRAVEGGGTRWVELPEGTPTVEDGFGGRNGLLIVEGLVGRNGAPDA